MTARLPAADRRRALVAQLVTEALDSWMATRAWLCLAALIVVLACARVLTAGDVERQAAAIAALVWQVVALGVATSITTSARCLARQLHPAMRDFYLARGFRPADLVIADAVALFAVHAIVMVGPCLLVVAVCVSGAGQPFSAALAPACARVLIAATLGAAVYATLPLAVTHNASSAAGGAMRWIVGHGVLSAAGLALASAVDEPLLRTIDPAWAIGQVSTASSVHGAGLAAAVVIVAVVGSVVVVARRLADPRQGP